MHGSKTFVFFFFCIWQSPNILQVPNLNYLYTSNTPRFSITPLCPLRAYDILISVGWHQRKINLIVGIASPESLPEFFRGATVESLENYFFFPHVVLGRTTRPPVRGETVSWLARTEFSWTSRGGSVEWKATGGIVRFSVVGLQPRSKWKCVCQPCKHRNYIYVTMQHNAIRNLRTASPLPAARKDSCHPLLARARRHVPLRFHVRFRRSVPKSSVVPYLGGVCFSAFPLVPRPTCARRDRSTTTGSLPRKPNAPVHARVVFCSLARTSTQYQSAARRRSTDATVPFRSLVLCEILFYRKLSHCVTTVRRPACAPLGGVGRLRPGTWVPRPGKACARRSWSRFRRNMPGRCRGTSDGCSASSRIRPRCRRPSTNRVAGPWTAALPPTWPNNGSSRLQWSRPPSIWPPCNRWPPRRRRLFGYPWPCCPRPRYPSYVCLPTGCNNSLTLSVLRGNFSTRFSYGLEYIYLKNRTK